MEAEFQRSQVQKPPKSPLDLHIAEKIWDTPCAFDSQVPMTSIMALLLLQSPKSKIAEKVT